MNKIIMFLTIHFFALGLVKANPIKVMIIDGGIDQKHELLKRVKTIQSFPNTKSSFSQSIFEHGTHISGLIIYGEMAKAKDTRDELCEEVEVIFCQVFDPAHLTNPAFFKNEKKCFDYALNNGVEYINMSLSGDDPNMDEYNDLVKLRKAGVTVVAAAGNGGRDIDKKAAYPASYSKYLDNIIVVGNTDFRGNWSRMSNYGKDVLKIGGEAILSTMPDNSYGRESGTSMSAAIYTHGILKQQCKMKTPKEVGRQWAI